MSRPNMSAAQQQDPFQSVPDASISSSIPDPIVSSVNVLHMSAAQQQDPFQLVPDASISSSVPDPIVSSVNVSHMSAAQQQDPFQLVPDASISSSLPDPIVSSVNVLHMSAAQQQDPFQLVPDASISSSVPDPIVSSINVPHMSAAKAQDLLRLVPDISMSSLFGSNQAMALSAAERKAYRVKFLYLVKVLLKILAQKDPVLLTNVRAIIKDCADRNRRDEPGWENATNVTLSMEFKLKEIVPEVYWEKSIRILKELLSTCVERKETNGR